MRPDPAFEAPWHAQLFALTVALNEAGHIAWPDWTQAFGANLARAGLATSLNGGDDYFAVWLQTLEDLLSGKDIASHAALRHLKDRWTRAYVATPHGQPVRI